MTADPFAEAEAVEETTEQPEQASLTAPAPAKDDPDANKVRVTFKGGTGYDAASGGTSAGQALRALRTALRPSKVHPCISSPRQA